VDFRILGRLEALDAERDVAPRRAKPRALLALFLLHPNERLPTLRIIEALWGEEPPSTADKALQGHVSALRKLLGQSRIRTEVGAYRLEVRPGELDLDRFSTALEAARAARQPSRRAERLAEALAIWRGEPLADLAQERFAQPAIARLEALRLAALEERAEAELELGHHAELLPELEALVRQHPFDEGLRSKLMLALYRSGRQSDALRVFREGRRLLVDELGIDPGSELQQLERRILTQDPGLAAPTAPELAPQPRQERKTVTVLVAEVVAASPIDPEDLERIAKPAVERIRAVVERLGGTAEPLFANALLGVFGAPRAHDDDPLRAVRAALEIREPVGDPASQLRVGIESGEALVTIDGSHVAVTGEVLATASRLQAVARLGEIVVGEGAHRATARGIDYRLHSTAAWSVLGPRRTGSEPTADTPFVGRADELVLLQRIYARARDERSVHLVTVAAEPGGGKTRLVREFRELIAGLGAPPTWRQGRCLPYGDGVTYWALGEIVKAQAGILESDDSETSARKLATAVADLEADATRRPWLARNLAALVGIEGAAASGDRDQAFAVWRQVIEAMAGQGPLVAVFEDIHWADEALLEFIEHVVSHVGAVPLLVLCTARLELLESRPGWSGGIRNSTTITLEPLSAADTERLLRSLLGRDPAPGTIKRAGGNPLFAQELAWMIGEAGSEGSIAIPDSLQAVIAARLDTLAPEVKALAADASVVGEVFWSGAVAAMGGLDQGEAEARLQRLVTHDVARRRRSSSVARQGEYAFRHVLVRDVAYRQIPRRDRIAKHRSAGEWIERLAGDRVTSHAELIAHHYLQALEIARALGDGSNVADLTPRARTFLTLAGDGARTLELTQAESFYRRALDLTADDDPGHGRLLSRLGEVAHLTGRLSEAEHLSRQAIAELQFHGDALGTGEAMVNLVATLWRLGRPEGERRRVAESAIRTLEPLSPGPELVRAYSHMATHELHSGRAAACGEWSRKALALADRLGLVALKVPPLHHLGIARFETGDEAGIDDVREAVRIGLEAGLSSETVTAQTNLAATIWVTEGPVAALALKRAAAELASSRGLVSLEKTIRAEALWQQHDAGAWEDALVSADALLAQEVGAPPSRVTTMAQTVKARILADRGRALEAAELEREYLARARTLRDPQDLGPALAAAAAQRMAIGDIEAAAGLIEELERVTRGRDPSQRIHELPHAARVCLAAGRTRLVQALIPSRGAPTYTRARLCLESTGAMLAEARGDLAAGAALHAAAADGWRTFGCPAEEAHALIGRGRCLVALERPGEAAGGLRRARRIGSSLHAMLILAEARRLLAVDRDGDAREASAAGD
jgi:DNA-binding SARP family transcriptional activator